jgi:hypothetical protein
MVSDAELLEEIDRLADGGDPPTYKKFNSNADHSASTAAKRFGSWNEAVVEAGYQPRNPKHEPQYTEQELLAEIDRLADGDNPPSMREFDRKSEQYTPGAVQQRFESWNEAVVEAGYQPYIPDTYIDESEVMSEIHRVATGDIGPTKREFNEQSTINPVTAERRFGSWTEAITKAGLYPLRHQSEKQWLEQLRSVSGRIAPPSSDYTGEHPATSYCRLFGSWWKACVRAGLQPHLRRPLTRSEWEEFFTTTVNLQIPEHRLLGLLSLLTGLPHTLINELTVDWISHQAGEVIVQVPASETRSGDKWTFRIPPSVTLANGDKRDTSISGLCKWYFDRKSTISTSFTNRYIISKIAHRAGLNDRKQTYSERLNKQIPLVRRDDLRVSSGIRMARHGAPAQRIRQHLGINQTNWKADVEDFFLWLYVREDFVHPDYDPPDVVLNPV